MTIDARIRDAIIEAATEHGQGAALSDKLIAWFNDLAGGNASVDDRDSVHRHLELLYEATVTSIDEIDSNGGQ